MAESRVNPVVQLCVPRDDLEAIGLNFVQVMNDHDLEGGLAACDPEIEAKPSRATGNAEGYRGHDGIREWWRGVSGHALWYEILVTSMQRVERREWTRRASSEDAAFLDVPEVERRVGERRSTTGGTLAMFGNVCLDGEPLSPWACVIVVRDGLVVRHRSYLSPRDLLDQIGTFADVIPGAGAG